MKSATAYYLLLLYATVMIRPFLPLLADAWFHSFNLAVHLATVHAQFGKDHLDAAFAKKTSDQEMGRHEKNTRTEDPVPAHVVTKPLVSIPLPTLTLDLHLLQHTSNLASVCLVILGPPPR